MPSVREQLVGAWRLVSVERKNPDGTVLQPYGPAATGMIIYSANGAMSVQIMNGSRPSFSRADLARLGRDELEAALDGYTAYCGRYEVDEQARAITHRRDASLYPTDVATAVVRQFELSGDRLMLYPPPVAVSGGEQTTTITWQRV